MKDYEKTIDRHRAEIQDLEKSLQIWKDNLITLDIMTRSHWVSVDSVEGQFDWTIAAKAAAIANLQQALEVLVGSR